MSPRLCVRALLHLFLLVCCACAASATGVFQDGFESGKLGPAWTVSGTNNGRATVTSDFAPAAGQYHLVLDDGVNDAIFSVAQATLSLDLANKKNVVLTFQAKSLGNEPQSPPTGNFTGNAAYDGVSISVDGGQTWRAALSLASVGSAWTTYTVTLDAMVTALGGSFNANTLIRFSEYDNSPAPIDGIAFDDVAVTADDNLIVLLDMPSTVSEGGGNLTGYVLFNVAPAQDTTVNLTASPAGQLALPASVIVPAGQLYAGFTFSAVDDNLVNFTRTVTVTPAAAGYTASGTTVTVYDNETVNLQVTVPAQLTEGVFPTGNATVSIDRPGTSALTVQLFSNVAGEVSLPSSVTIPAGATQAVFTIQAVDDTRLDGNVLVTITANATGLTPATAQTTTIDNEKRTLAVSFGSTTVQEGANVTGTVTLGGSLTSALTVTLSSSNPASAAVPASVTMPAGSTAASFTITAPDNTLRDGTRFVAITADASTFPTGTNTLTVRDNDVAGYRITGLADIVNLSGTSSITVTAADVEGNAISGFAGTVNLYLVLPDGTTQALMPATTTLTGTAGWTGSVTIPAVNSTPLRLRATDAGGLTGDSAAFDTMRVINMVAGDVIWDATRSRLYASVSSTDTSAYANKVITIDPATAQITGSVTTGNNPGQLALTSGGEQLYVALAGNGTISRITPASLAVNLNYAIGTDPNYGTYYARDICTVAGQPSTLVVARNCPTVSSSARGVAVFDNGVMRTNASSSYPSVDSLEPSADPSVYYGYNSEDTGFNFCQLKVDSTGIAIGTTSGNLISGFSTDIRSAGNTVYSTSGVKIDGASMQRQGTFAITGSGPVCPDPAANRVYYLEPDTTYASGYARIGAYDPNTFNLINKLSLPASITLPSSYASGTSFARWGANGLAVRTSTAVLLINSTRLVPTDAPANLAVQVQATPNPARANSPLFYTITVTNNGPNLARSTQLAATLSDSQTLTGVSATAGTPVVSGLNVTLPVGDLAAGTSAVLTLAASPQSAGSLTCTASATSNAVDPDSSDNWASKLVSVGFQSGADTINQLRLAATNLITDPTRNLLWASLPATAAAPLGRSVVSINPQTGLLSDPIPLNAIPAAGCMAISGNGRYLYVGLTDVPSIARIDLSANPPAVALLPLGINGWGNASYAQDVEVLDGDGTSFLVTTQGDDAAWVYDGAVRRANHTAIYSVTRIERTGTPGTFVGYDGYTSGFELSRLVVTAAGVTEAQYNGNVISGYYADLKGGNGNLALSSTGVLVNSSTVSLVSNLGVTGRPCLDLSNGRAYLVNGSSVRAFDVATSLAAGSLTLPVTQTGDWALNCVRWGLDGLAILGSDGKIYLARWSSTIPLTVDNNGNGIPDAWEATWFNSTSVNMLADSDGDGIANALEYVFNTSPTQASGTPVQFAGMTANPSGQKVARLIFPRRTGLAAGCYGYETSTDLKLWTATANVKETVLATQTINGVSTDAVQADVTLPDAGQGFVRIRWMQGASYRSNGAR